MLSGRETNSSYRLLNAEKKVSTGAPAHPDHAEALDVVGDGQR
jgi:hypothetical protein